jgi:hypothetical protein
MGPKLFGCNDLLLEAGAVCDAFLEPGGHGGPAGAHDEPGEEGAERAEREAGGGWKEG